MLLSNWVPSRAHVCFVLCCLAARTSAYFMINSPSSDTQWQNGQTYSVTWTKGVNDGISAFDVELARLSDDGLIYVARDVPCTKTSTPALNIHLQNIPPADDYFILFLNSTPGEVYATSPRFTILDSSSSPSASASSTPNPSVATVTVSGTPDPTKAFVTTFPASNGAILSTMMSSGEMLGLGSALLSCLVGAAWTLW